MKTTQFLYLGLFVIVILWVVTSKHLLVSEGYQNVPSEPVIAKGIEPAPLPIQAMPNESQVTQLPYGPYAQTASVGSYPYQDPALQPANLEQMKRLFEDVKSFLIFEGVSIADNSDPTVQLPLTQLRADSRKLEQEISVLNKNPGIQASLTQQDLADIEGSLSFLQRKVRLFQSSGLISDGVEGFANARSNTKPNIKPNKNPNTKTRATKADLIDIQGKIYSAILLLSSSGTTDPIVQARLKRLQNMYTAITDMITKVNKGIISESNISLYKEDITKILPDLGKPQKDMKDIFSKKGHSSLNPMENVLASMVGEENAPTVFKNLKENGSFRISVDLGYNGGGKESKHSKNSSKNMNIVDINNYNNNKDSTMKMNTAFDSSTLGMDDRAEAKGNKDSNVPGSLDWKKRTTSICEQVRLRGLDPLDFGCIDNGSLMSPAYSWRGHAKMVCGRLGSTLDPNLPIACGCPPQNWKGWGAF